jgi:hypothetical protein
LLGADDFRLSWSNDLHVGTTAIPPPIAAGISTKSSSHLGEEARDKSSKPQQAAQTHWLELSKVIMLSAFLKLSLHLLLLGGL